MRRLWGAARKPSGAGWEKEWAEAPQEAPGAWSGRFGPGLSGRKGRAVPSWASWPAHLALAARPARHLGGAGQGPRALDSGTAPFHSPASDERQRRLEPQLQHESRCRSSTPADAWRAEAALPVRAMGAPWGSPTAAAAGWRRGWRRGRGLPRTIWLLAAAGLTCTALITYGPPDWPPPRGVQALTAEEVDLRVLDYEEAAAAAEALATSSPRPPGQRWVWMNFESPSHSPGLRSLASNLFNWTLSYRADSDVFVPYGYLYPRSHPGDPPSGLAPPLSRKQGLVAWVVSHWDERQARVRYYHQLSQHVTVDVFGRGGPGQPVPEIGLLHTVARYKFYLAFENSQHLDYITEKLWRNALLAGAVPVVLGPDRANYERFVPRSAFIHVDDFPNASSLASYLLFLDRNPAVYRRYFHWRRSYAVHITSFWDEPWCRVCQAVQRAGDRPKSIRNLASWFER
uniref:Fucosyltransferase n=1 Tax=Nomascus leucogenys TaxID=61853 RepID=G1R651_NOMLE